MDIYVGDPFGDVGRYVFAGGDMSNKVFRFECCIWGYEWSHHGGWMWRLWWAIRNFLWPIRWNGVTWIWSSWVPHLASLLPSSLPNIFVCVRTFWNVSWCVVFRIIMLPMSYASRWLCWEDMWRIWLLRRYMLFDFFEILKLFWAISMCSTNKGSVWSTAQRMLGYHDSSAAMCASVGLLKTLNLAMLP